MSKQTDLADYLFDGEQRLHNGAAISSDLLHWMEASPRFTAFVETYRDKIRKKIRVAGDPESVLDLRSELEVAACLLHDRRLDVAYEPYASEKRRGPDFCITYRANQLFNIEVARIRLEENEVEEIDLARFEERVTRILLYKLGQMQPGMANLLAIHTRAEAARSIDLGRHMQNIKMRAERKDPAFYSTSRYDGPAAFFRDFSHLSGILFWTAGALPWNNKQSRPGLSEKILRLVSSISECRTES